MERKDFLRSLGAGAAFALTFPCLQGCSKDQIDGNIEEVPTGVDFTVDLTSQEGQALSANGGFILKNLVVVARNLQGEYVAASQVCSHESYDQVRFVNQDGGIFYCDVHGSRFSQDGTPLNQVDSKPARALKVFNTELDGSILRIFE
ncbi:Rieske (2Fe-2S) protein [Flagellimonas taeanensis]|jgi:Rieske Fe-S protein|uniref:Rieske [2Fe-2S] domain-containing protein n=1 Tax=Flagellimonas taeanensis TaxID=1005926 RepID=A0A1M6UMD8_9FLAO|nr:MULTISPECIES: Rieske 2Fe-2S domain-containing protein [Allomuricauda]MDC6385869.1 Rieske 2Fe-2S domain-containing protein [Muricauda sp. SK9]MEE1964253.1 Rieske 2Fe-2S domain-containing protein [Allomuricauda taeanensis]RIV50842.1 Rieske (2Fe-2S) protein [Allomuricauda taeanensis]SFC54750.1 Rieske [2Fe-2S] domain-containing protein [Allomuricauda taeanensis]SHK70435.1 Rieske [2Fe-2S] domain-containing protein [Allomuricauda taeanensis]